MKDGYPEPGPDLTVAHSTSGVAPYERTPICPKCEMWRHVGMDHRNDPRPPFVRITFERGAIPEPGPDSDHFPVRLIAGAGDVAYLWVACNFCSYGWPMACADAPST